MRTCGIVKFLAAFLLIVPPVVIGNGFKDYQLKYGYGIGEFRVLKWLNRFIRLDRDTDTPAVSQFPPIKIQPSPIPIENQPPFNPPNNPPKPNNIQTQQIAEAPQVENYPLPQSPSQDSSSKSSSGDSTEAPAPAIPSAAGPSHSYKDYLYMKWFHGSPKATYFNENPVPDKLLSVIDSKTEQGTNTGATAAAYPEVPVNQHFTNDEQQQQSTLFSFISDSILSRMFNTIKRMAVPKIQKEDIGPLKFYDEPPKPQSFPVPPKEVHFSPPYNPPQLAPNQTDQFYGSAQLLDDNSANNPSALAFDPANSKSPTQQDPAKIVSESDKPLTATTFNPLRLGYGLSETPEEASTNLPELAYDLSIPADNQPAEPSLNVPDNNSQPQATIKAAERIYVPLQTAYSPNKRLTNDNPSEQLIEPDNSALLLAFKPQVPKYA